MSIKTFLASLSALIVLGTAATACPAHDRETQAMSCSEGSTWDPEQGTCVPIASS